MSIKSILCAYSGDPQKGSGLANAIRIAKHHDAHLTGVVRHGLSFLHRQFSVHLPTSILDQLKANEQRQLKDIAERFRQITREAGWAERSQFIDLEPGRDGPLTEFSRAFDLVVMGNHTFTQHDEHLSPHPDLLALRSGRPVLVAPQGYQAEGIATHALVAWDGERAATRALVAATPLIENKAQVTLLSVGETPRNTSYLVQTLERHGVQVSAHTTPARGSVAQTIVQETQRVGAGLIVMGAYEHSKFSHDLRGGVTTDILDQTDVPVLMAH